MYRCVWWPSRHVDRDDVLCGISMVPLHHPDLPTPYRSHSACPLWAWHWYDREHGCAGCCILMYDSAERGAHFAERHFVPLYPSCTSRRRGILHRTLLRLLSGGSFASDDC